MQKKAPRIRKFRINIEYIETEHHCRCARCGQCFQIKVGNILRDKADEPYRITARCPTCGIRGRLTCRSFICRKLHATPGAKKQYVVEKPHDCDCGQVGAQGVMQEFQLASSQLLSLQLAVKHTLRRWEDDWNCSVMPNEMGELARILKECDIPEI